MNTDIFMVDIKINYIYKDLTEDVETRFVELWIRQTITKREK